MGGIQGTRTLATFVQWKAQRPLFYYQNLEESERKDVNAMLSKIDADGALDIHIEFPLERRNFKAYIVGRS